MDIGILTFWLWLGSIALFCLYHFAIGLIKGFKQVIKDEVRKEIIEILNNATFNFGGQSYTVRKGE